LSATDAFTGPTPGAAGFQLGSVSKLIVAITLRVMSGSTSDFRAWIPRLSSFRLAERDDDFGV